MWSVLDIPRGDGGGRGREGSKKGKGGGSPKRGKVNVNGRERIIDEIRNDLFS